MLILTLKSLSNLVASPIKQGFYLVLPLCFLT